MKTLDAIELFFKDYKNKQPLKLDDCTQINDVKQFASVHIQYLRSNSGNKRYLPYFDRLNKVYNICVKNKEVLNLQNKTK
tara:strand:+ start:340 stop:579 length:240 start_codon:yes stop_codon:yes gene_type:complete